GRTLLLLRQHPPRYRRQRARHPQRLARRIPPPRRQRAEGPEPARTGRGEEQSRRGKSGPPHGRQRESRPRDPTALGPGRADRQLRQKENRSDGATAQGTGRRARRSGAGARHQAAQHFAPRVMKTAFKLAALALLAGGAALALGKSGQLAEYEPGEELAGGRTTVSDDGRNAFSYPAATLSVDRQTSFF